MLKSRSNLIHVLLFLVLFLTLAPKTARAAILSLDPANAEIAINATFTVNLNLDTKNENTTATDSVLTFDPALLEITDVTFGTTTLYPTNTKILDNTTGKISLTSTQRDAVNSFTGTGTLAVFTFRAKALGTANLVFSCEAGKTNESNVFKKGTSTDVIECGNLVNGIYIISTTGSGTAPTRAPTPTRTLPRSGNFGPTALFMIGGTALLGIGALLIFVL